MIAAQHFEKTGFYHVRLRGLPPLCAIIFFILNERRRIKNCAKKFQKVAKTAIIHLTILQLNLSDENII